MISILKTYQLTLLTVAAICYLSFFTPPQTELNNISNIDKLVHTCMYGGLSIIIWWEYLRKHDTIHPHFCSLPHHDERNHRVAPSLLHNKPQRRMA